MMKWLLPFKEKNEGHCSPCIRESKVSSREIGEELEGDGMGQ